MLTAIIILTLVAFVYYFTVVAKKPTVIYQKNSVNEALVSHTPSLNSRYYVTPWIFNNHLQMLFLGLKKSLSKSLKYDDRDVLTMPDGGTVAVEWLGLDLPEDTPTMLVLHTISGTPHSMREFVRYMHDQLGWRVALCVRRGHGDITLQTPQFNTVGNIDDFTAQLAHVQSRFPQSDLYATGISAGSGVLARYLGIAGKNTPIKAAVAYCPAYSMRKAFARVVPFYSKAMTKKLHRLFIEPNLELFGHFKSLEALKETEDMHEFHQHLYEITGSDTFEDYIINTNPADVLDNIQVPILYLNAKDDPICHIDNTYEHIPMLEKMENVILTITDRGSHCAYFEGLTAKPWANRLIKEYFQSVRQFESTLAK